MYNQPLKMGPTEGSETSSNHNMTLGKYPEEHTQCTEHGESLKSRMNEASLPEWLLRTLLNES
jgi:hypothetical protein